MGAGVPSGLQNRFEELGASQVGSIPTYSRHYIAYRRKMMNKKQELLSKLPNVDETLRDQRILVFFEDTPRKLVVEAVRETISEERKRILDSCDEAFSFDDVVFFDKVTKKIKQKKRYNLVSVVNATGVALHTNLGRAVLADSACENVMRIAKGYSNLEYNLKKGGRGSRHNHVEELICRITGAEAAMVVNNNAAATMMCLAAMARGKEVIVSRGELVEIGGSFRIPEIMELSGARLVEVGTTNKTKLDDYRSAVNEETAAIMKVHTSNYRIVGFTEDVGVEKLAAFGRESGIPVIYDMGNGLLVDLKEYGVKEPTVVESLKAGADIILFSGDKLMGGPQAGIIAGKSSMINAMKTSPLARAFRVDKLTLAALEATFREYLDIDTAVNNIPVIRMLTEKRETMEERAGRLIKQTGELTRLRAETAEITGRVGGGSAPTEELESVAVKITGDVPAEKLERMLRRNEIPVIARIIKDEVHFDMRTVSDDEITVIAEALKRIDGEIGEKAGGKIG